MRMTNIRPEVSGGNYKDRDRNGSRAWGVWAGRANPWLLLQDNRTVSRNTTPAPNSAKVLLCICPVQILVCACKETSRKMLIGARLAIRMAKT